MAPQFGRPPSGLWGTVFVAGRNFREGNKFYFIPKARKRTFTSGEGGFSMVRKSGEWTTEVLVDIVWGRWG